MQSYIVKWNIIFPFDRWWRDKYNTPFASDNHLQACLVTMFFEYQEEDVIKEQYGKYKSSQDDLDNYKNTGDFYKKEEDDGGEMSDADMALFNDLDVDKL